MDLIALSPAKSTKPQHVKREIKKDLKRKIERSEENVREKYVE